MTKNNLLSEKLNYIGESETPTHLHVSSYNAEQIQTFRGHDIKDIQPLIKENCINWIQVHGLQNTETIHEICNYFNIDFLAIQDILNSEHPTKIEEHDTYNLVILNSYRILIVMNSYHNNSVSCKGKILYLPLPKKKLISSTKSIQHLKKMS